jgi:hypothetical protein
MHPLKESLRIGKLRLTGVLGMALLIGGSLSCGVAPDPEVEELAQSEQELLATNGLATNGLATNGLATNGLATNGLATNGLATNGLATNGLATNGAFVAWLREDPVLRANLMKYIVTCAAPAGEVRSYSDAVLGVTYTWTGQLGLAPDWASGRPSTEAEEQLISACLAAHANPYGVHVDFSIQGRDARGTELAFTQQELNDYDVPEACFFGNVFRNQGLYAGSDGIRLRINESTTRACGLSKLNRGDNPNCEPIFRIGGCAKTRNCALDASGRFYTQCTYQGVVYKALTTRIRRSEIHVCGDGICQVGESCGRTRQADHCRDCARCP